MTTKVKLTGNVVKDSQTSYLESADCEVTDENGKTYRATIRRVAKEVGQVENTKETV